MRSGCRIVDQYQSFLAFYIRSADGIILYENDRLLNEKTHMSSCSGHEERERAFVQWFLSLPEGSIRVYLNLPRPARKDSLMAMAEAEATAQPHPQSCLEVVMCM